MSATDSSPFAIEYYQFQFNINRHFQMRNLRHPDSAASLCINNVGSFSCVDMAEEKVDITRPIGLDTVKQP